MWIYRKNESVLQKTNFQIYGYSIRQALGEGGGDGIVIWQLINVSLLAKLFSTYAFFQK